MPSQDFVVLAPAVRSAGVPIVSPTVTMPANVLKVIVTPNLLLTDKLADGLSLTLAVERSPDGGSSWFLVAGLTWTSYGAAGYSSGTLVNPDPSVRFPATQFTGQQFRATLVPAQALSVGATITVVT